MVATYDTWKLARSHKHFEKLVHDERKLGTYTWRQLMIRMLKLCKNLPYSPITWLFLTLLGAISAMYGILVDNWVQKMFKLRRQIINAAGPDSVEGFILWTGWCVLVSLLATSIGHFAPASDGSGIPRMRALFAGVYQNPIDVLSFRTFVAKSIGTIIASGTGLSVGRAGPYTHIVSIIAHLMGRLSLFRRTYFGPENFNYLRAAVACGITASFGSPLGGVLYSIEVTAKYYEIRCLWEGVIGSSVCILVFKLIVFVRQDVLFERTSFPSFDMDWDLLAFVLLGVVTGIGAGLFCRGAMVLRWFQIRMFQKLGLTKPSYKRRVVHILSICITTGLITYPLKIMRLSDRAFVNEVFRDQALSLPQWKQITEFPNVTLFIYICLKFVTSILPCGSPLSIGVFGPLFTMGAAVGRLYGETLMKYWNPTQSPATYAVVGAASFASSATSTVSTAVIFFELTGQLSHLIPVMIACVVAYFVSGSIAPSIYDILAEWANLHAVCYDFNEYVLNQKYAEHHMSPVNAMFTRETTYSEALKALSTYKGEEYFPIVDDVESRMLIGAIRRYDLEVGLARFFAVNQQQLPEDMHPTVAAKMMKLVSETLRIDKKLSAVVDDVTLLNFENKDEATAKNPLQLGPPFNPFSFVSVPVESFPPQVGENVNLSRVHKIAAMYLWTKVYVVKYGKLLGEVHLESSLNKVKQEEAPVLLSP
ncbi:hypothetical protein Poli38472_008551 [Pythium oligandrum]|uniref:Chloride channel protein n=1 Tax=Pythium oligandrum TaxID=41045 RepID=A0A8K1FEI7_PYTOL|nr:hypothetical protein Poli38472_008551 [Pythium oligandrum]|eukprot:TMW55903.1 hypothetical protein Poli38472_008551 [Pythium oligandrum]